MKYAIKDGIIINKVKEGILYPGHSLVDLDIDISNLFDKFGIPKFKYIDGEAHLLTQEERNPFLENKINELRENRYWREANKFFMDAAYLRLCGKIEEAEAQELKFKNECEKIKNDLPKS